MSSRRSSTLSTRECWARKLPLLLCALSALSSACRAGDPVVVCLGDSTTLWRGERVNWTVLVEEALRADHPGLSLVNAGVSSDTTEGGRGRLWRVRLQRADVATVLFGINDALGGDGDHESRIAPERFRENLLHIVESLQGDGVEVLLLTPNPLRWKPWLREMLEGPRYAGKSDQEINAQLDRYADIVREVANATGATLVDLREAFESHPEGTATLLMDGMHPNDGGHRLMAARVLPVLREALATR